MDLEPGAERRGLRASDADRERVAEALGQAHAEGRLTAEEFDERVGRAYAARTYADLEGLTGDLPPPPPPARPATVPAAAATAQARRAFLGHLASYLSVSVLLVGIWALSGRGGFWPAWAMLGWGFAVVSHGLRVLLPPDPDARRRDRHRDRHRR
jgi:Domain of unknown function (DUF1707)/2TM domain